MVVRVGWSSVAVVAVLLVTQSACTGEPTSPPETAPEVATAQAALFTNSSFELGNLTAWTTTTGLSQSGGPLLPVTDESKLRITWSGGTNRTSVKTGAPFSLVPPGLTTSEKARYPRYGNWAAVVNELGSSYSANRITQSTVVAPSDVDPVDGLVHVRFTLLPVLQNPGHSITEQPYYYVAITNETTGKVLASRFNFSNEAGVPWQTNANGSVVYTDWLLFDLPLARNQVSIGDTLKATITAVGCSQAGHWGEAIVDSFGATIPGLAVYASGPDSVEAGADFQYTYRVLNGGDATNTGVRLTSYLPAGVTFRSVDTPGITCSKPSLGSRGTVQCDLGAVPARGTSVVKVTVRADTTAESPIRHGWYLVQSNQERELTGPVVLTAVTKGGTTQYVDLVTSVDDAQASVTWGQALTYTVTVRNQGPATATNAGITSSAPARLTNLAWTCTALNGASCGQSSGSGALATTATLPSGASVVYSVNANVVAGSGSAILSFSALATAPAGTVERTLLDNGAGDDDTIDTALVPIALERAGSGAGTLVSSPSGVSCGAGCSSTSGTFASGSTVSFQAVPAPGSIFAGWSGPCTGTGACTLTVGSPVTVTGTFEPNPVAVTSALTANAAVGRPFTYTVTALGPAPLTLDASGLPAWLSFDPATGRLTGTPPAAGTFNVSLSATSGGNGDTKVLVITAGLAPTITSPLAYTMAGSTTFWNTITVAATGATPMQFNASNLPGYVYFNSTTGQFNGYPAAVGVFNVPVVATNAFGSDYRVIAVSVGGAPVITSPLTASATVGTPFTYTLTSTGSTPLTLAASSLPAWASFSAATGVISGTPTAAGSFSIGLSATNGVGSSQQTLVLTVAGPAIVSSALTANGVAGEAFTYSMTADGTAPLTLAMSNVPAWATFDAETGLLSGTPPAPGSFTVTLTATNAIGPDSRQLVITIAAPPPTPTPPAITSALTASALVGVPFSYALTASGQVPMTFSTSGLPAWASFDAAAGVLSGTPTSEGASSVAFTASNDLGSDTKTVVFSVAAPPVITSSLALSGTAGQALSYQLTASGTAPLALSASGLPAWASFDAAAGLLSGTPPADGTWTVVLSASNAVGQASQSLVITVRTPPALTSSLADDAVVGVPFSYTATASGSAPLVFTTGALPGWASFSASTGVLSGTPDAEGLVSISLGVSNAAGNDVKTLALTVRTRPAITSVLAADAVVGVPFSYTLTASGTAPRSLSAASLPAWASFDPATGVLSGTPTTEGLVSVALGVSNAAGFDAKSLALTVRALPAITSALAADAVVGVPFSYTLTASGTAPRSLSASPLPAWASFNPVSGVLSGTPTAEGPVGIGLGVSNDAGSDARTLTITVRTRPAITSGLAVDAVVGVPFSYAVTASGSAPRSLSASDVPAWASFDPATGVLSGTPTAEGVDSVTLGVSNDAGSDAKLLAITVRALPAITSVLAVDAVVGVPFSYTVTASGTAPRSLSASDVPAWASFDAATGVLSGTPTAEGLLSVTLGVSNDAGSDAKTLAITVRTLPAITSVVVAEAVVGVPFSYTVTASGTAPRSLSAIDVPAWASFDPATGVLSGTPDTEGPVSIKLGVSNAAGSDAKTLALTVRTAPAITAPLNVAAVVGQPFSWSPTASGTAPFTFTFAALPPWAQVNAQTGALEGVPTADAVFEVAVEVTSLAGRDARTLIIAVRTAPAITSDLVAVGAVGLPFSYVITASGSAPITFTATDLPPGVRQVGERLEGVLADSGTFLVTLRASNVAGSDTRTLVVSVRPVIPVPGIMTPYFDEQLANPTPIISGFVPHAEAGNQVIVTEQGTFVCAATVQADGAWACEAPALGEGSHAVQAYVLVSSGLRGAWSAPRPFVIDLAPPMAPTWSNPAAGEYTPQRQPMLAGQGEPGAVVTVTFEGRTVCSALVDSGSAWACTPTAPLPEGELELVATQADAAGNRSVPVARTLIVDATAPMPVVFSAPAEGALLSERQPRIEGQAEPFSAVEVFVDGMKVCSAMAGADGRFACVPELPLTDGAHELSAVSRDAAGNVSAPALRRVEVDATLPAPAMLTNPTAEGGYVRTSIPVFSGLAEPLATVTVELDGRVLCVTTADARGQWSCPATAPLTDGGHDWSVTVRDAAGNESPALTGRIDVQTARGNVGELPSATATDNPVLTGTGTPGSTVNVYVDGRLVGTTTVGEDGSWSYALPLLPAGEHAVSVGFTNADGQEVYRTAESTQVVRAPQTDLGGGLGCSQAGSSPVWAFALLGALALLRRGSRRARVAAAAPLAAAVVVVAAGPAAAQVAVSGFDLTQLTLNPAARGGLVVDGHALLAPRDFRVALSLGYENSPLVYLEDGQRKAALVEHRFTGALSGAWAPLPWLEVGATLPWVMYQNGATVRSSQGETVVAPVARGASVGMPWLQGRVGVLREAAGQPLDLGLTVALGVPLGASPQLSRDESVSGQVTVGAGRTIGLFRVAAEAGALLRREVSVLPSAPVASTETVGSRLQFGVGVSTVGSGVRGELSGRALVSLTGQPLAGEVLAGVRAPVGSGLELFALAGPGIGNAPGTPLFRAALGVAFGGAADPRCGAGGVDPAGRCPDLDLDGDGVRNALDECPGVAAAGRADGCPARDADGDGVEDALDACPREAAPGRADGCPVRDADGDGLEDARDACPGEAAAGRADGCPVRDADSDGVEDALDACPREAGPGGCPTPPSATEGTPCLPGSEECAAAPAPQVALEAGRFELKGKVHFDTAKATLQARSFALLDEVARLLATHPEVKRLSIDGHTDARGDAAMNQALSLARARAVRDYLVAHGVEGSRLEARGFGSTRPIADEGTDQGRETNRRVEFVVLE